MSSTMTQPAVSKVNLQFVDETINRFGTDGESLIPILLQLQEHFRYLPKEALEYVAEHTDCRRADVIGVAHFYHRFRHTPAGEHTIRVCHGTACHVKNAQHVTDALHDQLNIPEKGDTDPSGKYTLEKVACLGCCTLAPVATVDELTFGYLTPDRVAKMIEQFEAAEKRHASQPLIKTPDLSATEGLEIRVGLGSCCMAKGSDQIMYALQKAVQVNGVNVAVKRVGCVGICHRTPWIEVVKPDQEPVIYAEVLPTDAEDIVLRHFGSRHVLHRLGRWLNQTLDSLSGQNERKPLDTFSVDVRDPNVSNFFDPQLRISTEHFGEIDPLDFDQYMHLDGFVALQKCFDQYSSQQVIDEVLASGMRGRGGAGFPTGRKWQYVYNQPDPVKYLICNGDEGDPGAFMDRMIMESLPFRVIEGMIIAAYAVGAHQAIIYVRNEYPLAVRRLTAAIKRCQERGLLGDHILGSEFNFNIELREGAGAFVCGEETALIQSLHGKRGNPTIRPPYPAEQGLRGKPTLVNNVETFATLPWVIRNGAEKFSAIGTEKSKGTKVFALAGKIKRGGLIEVPMGITIRQIIEKIGGGVTDGRTFKAVQIGGPSGGCIPAALADTPVDYEALKELGAMMGSGGLVVLDDRDCMVDMARYFLTFTQNESCRACKPCGKGTKDMLQILETICEGNGTAQDLIELEQMALEVQTGSLCGLGQTAPNPVLTTLKYFRDEYEAHLQGHCPSGKCKNLIQYRIKEDCIGCTLCAQHCPVDAIAFAPYRVHEIDQDKCTKCDACRAVCPEDSVEII